MTKPRPDARRYGERVRGTGKKKQISTSMDDEIRARIRACADADKCTDSDIVRMCVNLALPRLEQLFGVER